MEVLDVGGRILVVDDDRRMCELLEAGLGRKGFAVSARTSAVDALDYLGFADVEAVVTDLNMKGISGLELCERIAASFPDVPVVVITAFGSLETAVAAIRVGAYDFITKPFEIDELLFALDRAVQHKRLRDEVKRLRIVAGENRGESGLLGTSEALRKVEDLIERIADSEATVLITGESGTGKELVAKALHRRGRHAAGPFVAINCAAVPESLLESELFGHARGAFTDARTARVGLFAQANGGTLFLDEIGDLPLGLQPKLLRALQERVVRPLGSQSEIPFDVRVVAASNRDLASAVEEGRFREDLFFRVNVIHLEMPPLRARGGDVLLLAQEFVRRVCQSSGKQVVGLSSQAAERLLAYPWPGNVRELQNCIERAVTLARYEELMVDDLPEKIRSYRRSHVIVASDDPSELVPLEEVERRYILRVMEAVAGNKTLASRILGLDRKTLYRKLERFGEESAELPGA
jgi:two-component system response regulator HydG